MHTVIDKRGKNNGLESLTILFSLAFAVQRKTVREEDRLSYDTFDSMSVFVDSIKDQGILFPSCS